MISIRHTEWPDRAIPMATHILHDLGGDYGAAVWSSGEGPWQAFLPEGPELGYYTFFRKDGTMTDGSDPEERTPARLQGWVLGMASQVRTKHGEAFLSAPGCIILRALSVIFIFEDLAALCMISPLASGHQVLAEQAAIERGYSGILRFEN